MSRQSWLRLLAVAALLALALIAVFVFHVQDYAEPVLRWIDQHRVGGAVVFVFIYTAATILFLPGLLLSLSAGAIFGLAVGCIVVFAGAVLGETGAFVLGRLLLRDFLKTLTSTYPSWEAVDKAVAEEGWQMVLLLRLAPVVPFAALNYALGATSVDFWSYTWASALGIIPGVVVFVYLGSVAGSVGEVLSGRVQPPPGLAIAGVAVSAVAIFASGYLITVHARRAIQRRLDHVRSQEADPVDILDSERGVRVDTDAPEAPLLR